MRLKELLCEQLRLNGLLSFAEFMHLALYSPNVGYYTSALQKFGKAGDFITAPELTPLFGKTLATQCQQVLQTLQHPIVFEFGAGSGQLCVDILKALDEQQALPQAYYILEVSGHLQQRQQETINAQIPHLSNLVQWCSTWPTVPFEGVVIANEVLDAMPVHRFLQTKDGIFESFVTLDEREQIKEVYQPCKNQRLINHVAQVLPKDVFPYQSEVNLFVDDWILQCHTMLTKGLVLICDYGFPAHEYYLPDRNTGTLMCHYQHTAHADPFIHIGEQDITAHVDFTHVAQAAVNAGFHVAGYTNQASFLLSNGLLSLVQAIQEEAAALRAKAAVKQLLHPNEMGELFKVIALTKDLSVPLIGFQLLDKRASL